MNVNILLVFAALAALIGIGCTYVYAQSENTIIQTGWGLVTAVATAFIVMGGFIVYWAKKVRDIAEKKGNKRLVQVIDDYIIPLFTKGAEVAQTTLNQEVKIKQAAEVLFNSLPDKGASIRDKYEIRLVELTKDVEAAKGDAEEYQAKLLELEKLTSEIKAAYVT